MIRTTTLVVLSCWLSTALARPPHRVNVDAQVPFATRQLQEALSLRLPRLNRQVRVTKRPDGQISVALGQNERVVRLAGREGLDAARVVALVLLDLSTAPQSLPKQTEVSIEASPEPREPTPAASPSAISISLGPRLTVHRNVLSTGGDLRLTTNTASPLGFSLTASASNDIVTLARSDMEQLSHTNLSLSLGAHVRLHKGLSGRQLRMGVGAGLGRHWLTSNYPEFTFGPCCTYLQETTASNALSQFLEGSYLLPITDSWSVNAHAQLGLVYFQSQIRDSSRVAFPDGMYSAFQVLLARAL